MNISNSTERSDGWKRSLPGPTQRRYYNMVQEENKHSFTLTHTHFSQNDSMLLWNGCEYAPREWAIYERRNILKPD